MITFLAVSMLHNGYTIHMLLLKSILVEIANLGNAGVTPLMEAAWKETWSV